MTLPRTPPGVEAARNENEALARKIYGKPTLGGFTAEDVPEGGWVWEKVGTEMVEGWEKVEPTSSGGLDPVAGYPEAYGAGFQGAPVLKEGFREIAGPEGGATGVEKRIEVPNDVFNWVWKDPHGKTRAALDQQESAQDKEKRGDAERGQELKEKTDKWQRKKGKGSLQRPGSRTLGATILTGGQGAYGRPETKRTILGGNAGKS